MSDDRAQGGEEHRRRPERPAPPAIVWVVVLIFVGFELVFQASDAGVLPLVDLRWEVAKKLAFFDIYFEAALGGVAVPIEFYTSFVTHAFLHGGALHLLMNGAVFLAIGGMIANQLGPARFLILCAVTAAGGALTFALITDIAGPLVGASGVIFGFFGALKRWEWRWLAATGESKQRFWGTIGALVLLNALLVFAYPSSSGGVAWDAHLGGFIAGWLIAPILAPGRAGPSPI